MSTSSMTVEIGIWEGSALLQASSSMQLIPACSCPTKELRKVSPANIHNACSWREQWPQLLAEICCAIEVGAHGRSGFLCPESIPLERHACFQELTKLAASGWCIAPAQDLIAMQLLMQFNLVCTEHNTDYSNHCFDAPALFTKMSTCWSFSAAQTAKRSIESLSVISNWWNKSVPASCLQQNKAICWVLDQATRATSWRRENVRSPKTYPLFET